MARPRLPINDQVVEGMAQVGATNREIAEFVGCDESLMSKPRFSSIIAKARAKVKWRLRQVQTNLALNGDRTMLVWLGKQMLGQTDKQEIKVDNLEQMTDDELRAVISGRLPTSAKLRLA